LKPAYLYLWRGSATHARHLEPLPGLARGDRQISAGSQPLLDADRDKPTVIALREIAPQGD